MTTADDIEMVEGGRVWHKRSLKKSIPEKKRFPDSEHYRTYVLICQGEEGYVDNSFPRVTIPP
jgi:hypothetical protein